MGKEKTINQIRNVLSGIIQNLPDPMLDSKLLTALLILAENYGIDTSKILEHEKERNSGSTDKGQQSGN